MASLSNSADFGCLPIPFVRLHPDEVFASCIWRGLSEGFRVGYNRGLAGLRYSGHNHPSSLANQSVVDSHLAQEVQMGRMVGPLPIAQGNWIHLSPVGLVPKSHSTNKWRMIVDLSSRGHSINDGINEEPRPSLLSNLDKAHNW